ncbi:MAG: DedA family protein [Burkholderiales bacterium PBB6]|nr:MAG: DedA family protein [Burkholderiales bacterium PBB6]
MDVFNALLPIFTEYGYLAVFTMLLICGFGIPVPEDVTLVTGGVIAGLGYADPHTMFAVGMAGVLIGDGMVFAIGRFQGEKVMRWRIFRKVLTPERYASAQGAFEKYGRWVMFVARFLPGLRTPVFFTAGMSCRVSVGTWFLMDGVAALISVPIWVYLGYFGARNWDWMWRMVHSFQYGIFGLLGIGLVVGGVLWRRRRNRGPRAD